jgi:hypothetical protein
VWATVLMECRDCYCDGDHGGPVTSDDGHGDLSVWGWDSARSSAKSSERNGNGVDRGTWKTSMLFGYHCSGACSCFTPGVLTVDHLSFRI